MPEGGPENPAESSEESIKASLSEPSGTAAGMDFGQSEPSGIETASDAISGLTAALVSSDAVAAEAKSQLGVSEVQSALDRGLPADEVLAAGLSSGAISAEQADELAWSAARAEATGFDSDEELEAAEVDDETWDEIDQLQQSLLAQAGGLAQYETAAKQGQQASEAAFAQSVANHERSAAALRALQHEIGLSGPEMRQHLSQIDAEAEAGILGVQVDLDRLAKNDSELFSRALNAISATVRASENEFEGRVVKTNAFALQPDFAAGWTINGQPAGPEQYTPGIDPEKLTADAVRRAQGRGPYDGPVNLPADRNSVESGYTIGGRRVHQDDIPIGDKDGGTARSRLKEQLRGGKP